MGEEPATSVAKWCQSNVPSRSREWRVNGKGHPGDAESRMLDVIQREAFSYFAHETNRANGLVVDTTSGVAPSSIAAIGLGLTAYPVAVERGFISRVEAAERTLTTLRFFWGSKQGPEPDATGYRGFYYHFLDMRSGARAWQCELSTVDSALLLAGMLTAAEYFDEDKARRARDPRSRRSAVRAGRLAVGPERRRHGDARLDTGSGFLPYRWEGYDEALLLYVLGLGSPTHPLPAESYRAWAATYEWRTIYDTHFCTRDRSSSTSSRICGSTSAESRTRSCADTESTISRTVGAPR